MSVAHRTTVRGGATANRLVSASVVATYGTATLLCIPDSDHRAAVHYAVVITLGYGHLLGAWLAPLSERRSTAVAAARAGGSRITSPAGWPRRLAAWSALLLAFVLFTGWLASSPLLVMGLLAVATWHTVENDLAMDDAGATAGRPGPLSRSLDAHLAALGLTLVLVTLAGAALAAGRSADTADALAHDFDRALWLARGLALAAGTLLVVRERDRRFESIGLALIGAAALLHASLVEHLGLVFADVFAAATGYHLVSWLGLSLTRCRAEGVGATRLLVATHAPPVAIASLCAGIESTWTAALRREFFAAAPYLFWSVAHVAHTVWRRERRRSADLGSAIGNGRVQQ